MTDLEKALAEQVAALTKALIQIRDYDPHPSHCDHIHDAANAALSRTPASLQRLCASAALSELEAAEKAQEGR